MSDWMDEVPYPGPHTDGVGWDDPRLTPWNGVRDEAAAHFTMQPDGTLVNNTPITFTVSPHVLVNEEPDYVAKIINSYGVKVNTVQQFYEANGNYRFTIT